ncbi:MAG: hypothetical protein Q9199_004842 [Rusavskia elegans]
MDRGNPVEDDDFYYETSAIYAFPTSLAALTMDYSQFDYDCTPWLSPTYRGRKCRKLINDHASPYNVNGDTEAALLPFGTTNNCRVYAVFPHLDSIGETSGCKIFKKWHDKVMLDALTDHSSYAMYPQHHRMNILNSQVERVEMGRPEAPLEPITYTVKYFPSVHMHKYCPVYPFERFPKTAIEFVQP